jgi:hypothetical protein
MKAKKSWGHGLSGRASKCEALSSKPSTTKKKKEQEKGIFKENNNNNNY